MGGVIIKGTGSQATGYPLPIWDITNNAEYPEVPASWNPSHDPAGFVFQVKGTNVVDGVQLMGGNVVLFYHSIDSQNVPTGVSGWVRLDNPLYNKAPILETISSGVEGVVARLSFGTSNPITNYTNHPTIDINGVMDIDDGSIGSIGSAVTAITGELAPTVVADLMGSFPEKVFGYGNVGTLSLKVNGVLVHTVNLETFSSGPSVNANGSGFTLSASQPVLSKFGVPVQDYQYRSGTYSLADDDMVLGYNAITIEHSITGVSNVISLIRDMDNTPLSFVATAVSNITPTLTLKHLSGVAYHTAISAEYTAEVDNVHRNIYSNAVDGVRVLSSFFSLVEKPLPVIVDEADPLEITELLTLTTNVIASNTADSINCIVKHPLKPNLSSVATAYEQATPRLLVDNVTVDSSIDDSGGTLLFNNETHRLIAGTYTTQASVGSGTWNSVTELDSAPEYMASLLVHGSFVKYPTQGVDGGDFRTVSQGNANGPELAPNNPDYSILTGDRAIYLRIHNDSGDHQDNVKITLIGSGEFVGAETALSGENLHLELKVPASDGPATGWMDCTKSFSNNPIYQYNDGDGCLVPANGAGNDFGVEWYITFGVRSIAPGDSCVLRLTAPSTWTGLVEEISFEWA